MLPRLTATGLLGGLAAAALAMPAQAAFISLSSQWSISPDEGFTDEITITCNGAESSVCFDVLTVERGFTASESGVVSRSGTITFTNNSDAPAALSWRSAFTGIYTLDTDVLLAEIDHAGQRLSFVSTVTGLFPVSVTNSCSLPTAEPEPHFTALQCGRHLPDYAEQLNGTTLAPGESVTDGYTLTISYSFVQAPEPTMLALFAPALLGLGLLRRRGQPS